jgi:predicted transposase YdaD
MTGQSSPHDAVFRRVLGEPTNAASQLQAVLPAGLTGRLDLNKLTRVPGSFVDAELRWRHSDLLFTAPLEHQEAFIYILVEHQSSPDPLMAFRILRYLIRIWDRYLAEHPEATRLPAVIPLVVHHNRRPWTGPTDIRQLLDLDPDTAEAVGDCLPQLRFLLDDLARLDEPALRARPLTPPARMTLLLLKTAPGNPSLAADLRRWADDLRAVLDRPDGIEDFVALVTYIETVGEIPTDELHDLFAQLGSKAEEAYMTTAEMLRAEGRAEGEARGRAEGEARGRADALVQLLTHKFGPLPPAASERVRTASIDQLATWTTRAITADTLDEALR